MKYLSALVVCIFSLVAIFLWISENSEQPISQETEYLYISKTPDEERKKILFVDSYHRGYKWADGIRAAILDELNILETADGRYDQSNSRYALRIYHMDTKRNSSPVYIEQAALEAKNIIESWQPDLIITADDNAAKYLVQVHLRNSTIPLVFCGINWDAEKYGFPYNNMTGMVEVSLLSQQLEMLAKYSDGNTIGFLGADVETNRRQVERLKLYDPGMKAYLVSDFDSWQTSYLEMQKEADLGFVAFSQTIEGWDMEQATSFLLDNASIPLGSWHDWQIPHALLGVTNDPGEHGQWVAQTAKRILAGENPVDIPVTKNKRASLQLNMDMAQRLGVIFPPEWMQRADMYHLKKKRVLYVNSYHKGYTWSDGIERGFAMALDLKLAGSHPENIQNNLYDVRFIRMDSKNNPAPAHLEQVAAKIIDTVERWKPDALVLADDNALKYLTPLPDALADLPIFYCGINGSKQEYGLPLENVRGMMEVDPFEELMERLKLHANGNRVGLLGANRLSTKKVFAVYLKAEGVAIEKQYLVDTMQEWQESFARLQEEVDIVFLANNAGITDWDTTSANRFVHKAITIPVGTTLEMMMDYAAIGMVRVPDEQGWWVGQRLSEVLGGEKSMGDIASVRNKENLLLVNFGLASKLDMRFSREILESATPHTPKISQAE